MNNLHRELAPISDAAWTQIEQETSRTLKRHLAGRRVVDMHGPGGASLSAVGTGHLLTISAPRDGVVATQREVKALVEAAGSVRTGAPSHRRRRAWRKRLRLAAGEGCRAQARLCRGRCHIRRLCRRWNRGYPAGDQQSGDDAAW